MALPNAPRFLPVQGRSLELGPDIPFPSSQIPKIRGRVPQLGSRILMPRSSKPSKNRFRPALGRIKYQSVVDQNWDQDHTIRDMPVTALVAYAAQQLTISAFEEELSTSQPEGILERLLAAAAWLSPVDAVEEVTPEGERLTIRDRWEFVKQIEITLTQHVRGERPLNNGVLIDLIHGMHASIPRGSCGSPSSIIPFLPLICEDHSSPWSEDESVLRALITYALDRLSHTKKREPLVERKIKFNELALELIDTIRGSAAPTTPTTLVTPPAPTEVAVFGFWLIHRVPYAFGSRKSMLVDIIETWASTKRGIPEDHHKRLNFHTIGAFVAVAQCRLIAKGKVPKSAVRGVLILLGAALEDRRSQLAITYALALILNLGTPKQATTLSEEVDAERSKTYSVPSEATSKGTQWKRTSSTCTSIRVSYCSSYDNTGPISRGSRH